MDAVNGLPGGWPVTNVAIKSDRLPMKEDRGAAQAQAPAPPTDSEEPSFVQFGLPPLTIEEIVAPALEIMSLGGVGSFDPLTSLVPSNAALLIPPPEDEVKPDSPAEEEAVALKAWARLAIDAGGFRQASMRCLAEAIYFEARGETAEGQAAVAQVVLNRVHSPYYPDTVCDVVYENQERRNKCQFSFACDGERETITNRGAWGRAEKVAGDVGEGRIWLDKVAFSTHYHADYVKPYWISDMVKTDVVGSHIFYRVKDWDIPDPEAVMRSASAAEGETTATKVATP